MSLKSVNDLASLNGGMLEVVTFIDLWKKYLRLTGLLKGLPPEQELVVRQLFGFDGGTGFTPEELAQKREVQPRLIVRMEMMALSQMCCDSDVKKPEDTIRLYFEFLEVGQALIRVRNEKCEAKQPISLAARVSVRNFGSKVEHELRSMQLLREWFVESVSFKHRCREQGHQIAETKTLEQIRHHILKGEKNLKKLGLL